MANEAKQDKKAEEKKPEEKKALLVESVRQNKLRINVFYIKLNNGKMLNTRSEAHVETAFKLLKGKTPVAYKEEPSKTDGHLWLVELKAA